MKEFLTKNFVSLLVLVLLVIVYLQRCGGEAEAPRETHDTVTMVYHHYHDSTIVSKPVVINHLPARPQDLPPQSEPDADYSRLLTQYNNLRGVHYSRNIVKDSLTMTSGDTIFGTVSTIDTVQENRIVGRKWTYHLDIPEKVTTITNTYYPAQKRQVYIGGAILGNQTQLVAGAKFGLFYKDRRDRIFGAAVQKTTNQPLMYELSNYWKIRLRRP